MENLGASGIKILVQQRPSGQRPLQSAGRTAFGRAVGRTGEENGRVRPPSKVIRTGCEPMHTGVCISPGLWGGQPPKRLFSSPPLYIRWSVVMHQKMRYAIQYSLLTLEPHATDTRVLYVTRAAIIPWSHSVNVMSDNLRLRTGFLVALRYLGNFSSSRQVTKRSMPFRRGIPKLASGSVE